jgi:hypothetical protein
MEVFLFGALAAASGLLLTVAVHERAAARRAERTWQAVELRFPRDLSAAGVRGLVEAVAGLPRSASVVLEVVATSEGVRHRLGAPRATLDSLGGALRAHVPGARLAPVDAAGAAPVKGIAWRLVPREGVLRQPTLEALSGALLAALLPLRPGEQLTVRWVLGPTVRPPLRHARRGPPRATGSRGSRTGQACRRTGSRP